MPYHVHPWFRSLEEALESDGLIQALNTALVDEFLAEESAGSRIKQVPVAFTRIIRGTAYTAS